MSVVPPSAPAAAAASARAPLKKRPRHFWDKPDPADEANEEKQGAEHVSPVTRLYRHALESVFAFLKLRDLSVALAVCRSWSSAVRSMASIGATVVDPTQLFISATVLVEMCRSARSVLKRNETRRVRRLVPCGLHCFRLR